MAKPIRSSWLTLAAVSVLSCGLLLGCGGQQKPKEQMAAETKGLPKWALGKCQEVLKNKDALCASGSVQGMSNINLARSAAEGRARTELSRMLQVRVKSMLKDYQAATTGGPDNQSASEQHIEDVSKQVTDMTLSGSRLEDTFVNEETGTFWALVVLDADAFKDSLSKVNTLDERMRAHIVQRADRAFRELDYQTGP
jgi:hypothetical protein